MNAMHPVHRIASFATALAIAGALVACTGRGTDNGAGNTEPVPPAAVTAATANVATAPAGGAAVTTDNAASSDTSAIAEGAAMGNTARGTTVGDLNASGAPPDATRPGGNANDTRNGSVPSTKP